MTAPLSFVFIVLGLIVSARTRLTGTVLGQPISVPALWLAFAAVVLALAALVLVLARLLLRDGLRLRPRMVAT
jgi:hypothetical protein